jgi:hypothetical protein
MVAPQTSHSPLEASFLNLRQLCQILGESPVLEASKASSDGVLDVTFFLKALLKNLLQPVACLLLWSQRCVFCASRFPSLRSVQLVLL